MTDVSSAISAAIAKPAADVNPDDTGAGLLDGLTAFTDRLGPGHLGSLYTRWQQHPSAAPDIRGGPPALGTGPETTDLPKLRGLDFGHLDAAAKRLGNLATAGGALTDAGKSLQQQIAGVWPDKTGEAAGETFHTVALAATHYQDAATQLGAAMAALRRNTRQAVQTLAGFADGDGTRFMAQYGTDAQFNVTTWTVHLTQPTSPQLTTPQAISPQDINHLNDFAHNYIAVVKNFRAQLQATLRAVTTQLHTLTTATTKIPTTPFTPTTTPSTSPTPPHQPTASPAALSHQPAVPPAASSPASGVSPGPSPVPGVSPADPAGSSGVSAGPAGAPGVSTHLPGVSPAALSPASSGPPAPLHVPGVSPGSSPVPGVSTGPSHVSGVSPADPAGSSGVSPGPAGAPGVSTHLPGVSAAVPSPGPLHSPGVSTGSADLVGGVAANPDAGATSLSSFAEPPAGGGDAFGGALGGGSLGGAVTHPGDGHSGDGHSDDGHSGTDNHPDGMWFGPHDTHGEAGLAGTDDQHHHGPGDVGLAIAPDADTDHESADESGGMPMMGGLGGAVGGGGGERSAGASRTQGRLFDDFVEGVTAQFSGVLDDEGQQRR